MTLVEVLVAMGLLGVLVTLTLTLFNTVRRIERVQAAKTEARTLVFSTLTRLEIDLEQTQSEAVLLSDTPEIRVLAFTPFQSCGEGQVKTWSTSLVVYAYSKSNRLLRRNEYSQDKLKTLTGISSTGQTPVVADATALQLLGKDALGAAGGALTADSLEYGRWGKQLYGFETASPAKGQLQVRLEAALDTNLPPTLLDISHTFRLD